MWACNVSVLHGHYITASGKVKDNSDAKPQAHLLALVLQKIASGNMKLVQHLVIATPAAFASFQAAACGSSPLLLKGSWLDQETKSENVQSYAL